MRAAAKIAAFVASLASRAGFGGISEALSPRAARAEHLDIWRYRGAVVRQRRNYTLPHWGVAGGWATQHDGRSLTGEYNRHDDAALTRAEAKRQRRAVRYRRELRAVAS